MKKKILLPLFLVPFIVGCGAQTQTVEELIEVVEKYPEIKARTLYYTVETKGRAFGYDMDNTKYDQKIYKKRASIFKRTKSVLFSIPLKLDKETFYMFDEFLDPQCQYYNIKGQMIDMDGSPTQLQSEILPDGGLKFWAINSNNKVKNFGHYATDEEFDPADPYTRLPIDEFSGKLDGCYIYDKNGFLVYEEFKTHTQNGPDKLTANTTCTYEYYYD